MRRRRVDLDLAGEHDLLELARPDPLDGARDRRLVVLGRRDARRSEAPGGRRVEQRQRPRAQLAERARSSARRRARSGMSSGAASAASVSRTSPPRRASATSGTVSDGRPEARPVRRAAAVGREREAADRDEPGAGGPSGASATAVAGELAPVRRDRPAKRPGPRASSRAHAAERGQRGAVAVGLLEAEPRLAGAARGEGDRARVDARASGTRERRRAPRRRSRRARRTARSQRVAARTSGSRPRTAIARAHAVQGTPQISARECDLARGAAVQHAPAQDDRSTELDRQRPVQRRASRSARRPARGSAPPPRPSGTRTARAG